MSNAGEAGVKKHSSWGAVGIDGLGLENGFKSLGLYFLTDYQISHFTHFSSRFFSPVAPQGLTSPLQVPSLVLGAVSVAATLFGGHRLHLFASFL